MEIISRQTCVPKLLWYIVTSKFSTLSEVNHCFLLSVKISCRENMKLKSAFPGKTHVISGRKPKARDFAPAKRGSYSMIGSFFIKNGRLSGIEVFFLCLEKIFLFSICLIMTLG